MNVFLFYISAVQTSLEFLHINCLYFVMPTVFFFRQSDNGPVNNRNVAIDI